MNDRIYPNEFYGDNTRWFIGVVEDINDPLQLSRVRVRVRGVHSASTNDIDVSDLPWAQSVLPTTEGGVSGLGRSGGLRPGAEVFGMFLDGKGSQLPIVLGSIPKIEYSSSIQEVGASADGRIQREQGTRSTGAGTGVTGERNKIEPLSDEAFGTSGNSNAEKAFNYFVSYGFTPQQAAGIVGNLMKESGPSLDTSIKAAGTEQSFGIAQWNASAGRYRELLAFAEDLNRDWRELEVQLRFITHELETKPYLGMSQLRSATTIEQAAIAFEEKYERPGIPGRAQRISYARDIYNRMAR